MFSYLANPDRFMRLTKPVRPYLAALTLAVFVGGLYLSFASPEDYQQGDTVRIMYVHVPAAWMGLLIYALMGGLSFFGLVFGHVLADAAAKAMAPIGAVFTALALITGALWGKPMWGTWWEWDGRMTSVLVLFLIYISYMALHAALEDEVRAAKAAAVLAMVGLINLPIIKFSVDWWNTLHQGASVLRVNGPSIAPAILWPLLVMALAFHLLFIWLFFIRLDAETLARKLLRRQAMLEEG
jgi:heme exporter protein C